MLNDSKESSWVRYISQIAGGLAILVGILAYVAGYPWAALAVPVGIVWAFQPAL